jgi:hypothetical protein
VRRAATWTALGLGAVLVVYLSGLFVDAVDRATAQTGDYYEPVQVGSKP